ncbi:arsenic transporter [Pseudomonas sp. EpS/L25]|uniref:arsenic transporter n=1 Tax=Pseudomonas sp. EpS/L25 TaxID=1749078 RepID=UPI0007435165|nr:arsenic transporter [Pseudomonas sp. EpS/L25]KUM39911.1 arsenic transporter [Pseudomonas sp. EpS/L25]
MGFLGVSPHLLTWIIAGLATLGVVTRPFGLPEALFAVAGAVLLALFGLLSLDGVWHGIAKGTDVYLFLIGMMLLAEIARKEGLFDWVAGHAVRAAKGSALRLFALVYGVGILVTVFLSNDACAVVLTPAVYYATRAAQVKNPLPYLFSCAFIANAASFVLPISNPANLVVFAEHMPELGRWLALFTLPSILAIAATFLALWATQAKVLRAERLSEGGAVDALPTTGRIAGCGLILTILVLLGASALDLELGLPTFLAGFATFLVVACKRGGGLELLKHISWGVLPLVAGLFVLVEALETTGVLKLLAGQLQAAAQATPEHAAWGAGLLVAFGSNLVNNLPAGLLAGAAVQAAHVSEKIAGAVLIGIDLGPNLSITGSLATLLWLAALRREGLSVSFWQFLKLGTVVMIPALLLALAALIHL